MSSSQTHTRWSVTSPSFLVSAALASFMLFLAVRGLLAPAAAAHGFGLDLVDARDSVWLQVKGDRDLTLGLVMTAFLALRWRRALGVLLLASIGAPALDCLLSLATPGHHTSFALSVHGGTAALVAVLGLVLVRRSAGSAAEESEMSSSTTASAAR